MRHAEHYRFATFDTKRRSVKPTAKDEVRPSVMHEYLLKEDILWTKTTRICGGCRLKRVRGQDSPCKGGVVKVGKGRRSDGTMGCFRSRTLWAKPLGAAYESSDTNNLTASCTSPSANFIEANLAASLSGSTAVAREESFCDPRMGDAHVG